MPAPLKPQQRILMIHTYLLPGHQHQISLMRKAKIEMLNDHKCLRWYLRKMPKLPIDTQSAIIYADFVNGGLVIQSFPTIASVLNHSIQEAKWLTTDNCQVLAEFNDGLGLQGYNT